MRMRRRRVERCLLRASVAIEAGVLEDAREAIEEIRRLDPNEPGLEQLTAQLAEAENPPPVEELLLEHPTLPALVPDDAPARSRPICPGGSAAGWRRWRRMVVDDVQHHACGTAGSQDGRPSRRPARLRAHRPHPSVRVSETSVAAPISAEPLRGGDAPIATSGLAAIEGNRAEPDARASGAAEQPRPPVDAALNAPIVSPGPAPVQESPASVRDDPRPAFADTRSSRSSATGRDARAAQSPASRAGETRAAGGFPGSGPGFSAGRQRRRGDCHAGVRAIGRSTRRPCRPLRRRTPRPLDPRSRPSAPRSAATSPRTTGSTRRRRRASGPASMSAPWRVRSKACRRSQFRLAGAISA